jgi:hypothetical protein
MFRARMFAICCGYEDADDLDHLRSDPAFKLACGRLPDTGRDLCSQPTLSRLENAPSLRDVVRLTYTLVDAWMDSYPCEPTSRRLTDQPAAGLDAIVRKLLVLSASLINFALLLFLGAASICLRFRSSFQGERGEW